MNSDGLSILLIEDSDQLAGTVSRELEREYGHSVTWLRDPTLLPTILAKGRYDVAIIDLLYEHLNREFDARRLSGRVMVRDEQLLITGLTAIRILRELSAEQGIVVWTSGEATRRLHLLFSYEDLWMRVYSSKSPGTGRADTLEHAAMAARDGGHYFDPVLNPYLPVGGGRGVSSILLHDECRRAIWRAIAAGAHSRADIGRLAGYSARTIGNRIPEMYDDLLEFDSGLVRSRSPFIEVVRYASTNWHFFLDDAVRSMFP